MSISLWPCPHQIDDAHGAQSEESQSFYLAVWLVIGTISNQLTTLPSN